MARKKRKPRGVAATRLSDEDLIARLQDEAPEALAATIPEVAFEATVEGVLKESPDTKDVLHFFCRPCGEYHLKTHPHYRDRR
jgi:hypothetical protein